MRLSGIKKAPATGRWAGLCEGIDEVQFVKTIITQSQPELNKTPQNEKRGQRRASSLLMPALFRWVYRGYGNSNIGLKIHTSASKQACILFAGVNGLKSNIPMYNNRDIVTDSVTLVGKAGV